MKTVVIVHHTGEWGGGTKSLVDLCDMLRKDYQVIVCIPKGYPEFSEKLAKYGCGTHELTHSIPFINIYSGRPPLVSVVTMRSIKSLRNIKTVGDEILELKPDVVIFNTLITAVTARYLSKHTKVICIDRETLTSGIAKLIYRKLLDGKLDAITCLSEYERQKINFKKTISAVFPDCVKLDALVETDRETERTSLGIDSEKYVILFMGGLAKIKGTDVMLEALNKLDDRFLMLFAGAVNEAIISTKQLYHDIKYPGIYRFKKKVIRQYYPLKNSVKLYETGLRDSVDELIVASDMVVFPSTSVHQPRPCIEAGAYEKPVIISDYPETTEYFKEGYNALIFKPGDSGELAQKIEYAYSHRKEMEEMGKRNRAMTETKHDFYDCKAKICSLIEKVCNNAN